ncbi:Myelin regulatory factor, partial [Geodia barretti]
NFDNDCDYLWLKSSTPESIYHHGRVGINTDKPEEALSVNGNIRVTGCIEHPSDMRIKTDILPVDSSRQLERVCQMRLYQYRYKDGVMRGANPSNESRHQVGVLAQELRDILPDAVHET